MNDKEYFSRFQKLCIDILAQSDNCMDSQIQFRAAKSVPELVTAWQHFWAGVLHEVPEQVIKAFSDLYPVYRTDIIRAGIYYNEAPPIGTSPAMVLIGDNASVPDSSAIGSSLVIQGRHRVYVLGNLPITVTDNCAVHVASPRANVTAQGNSRVHIEQGTLIARERAVVNGKGDITCYDSTTIFLAGGTLTDHGHLDIRAFNDAVVNSFTSRNIHITDKAVLNIR